MAPPTSLQTQRLGKNGPQVPRIGVGLMNLSMFNQGHTRDEALAFLDNAWNKSQVFWDTADEYADSEDLIGAWFKLNPSKRNEIFLSTKFGMRGQSVTAEGKMELKIDSTPEYCHQAIDKSLKRLGLPGVDIFYVHRLDQVTPIEKTMQAMVELKEAGKIKYIGLSECSAESLRRAYAVHPVTAVQVEYSPSCLAVETSETKLLETCRELGVAVVCYSPLGNGLLGGNIRSHADVSKPGDPRGHFIPAMRAENIERNVAVVDQIGEIAKKKGCTVGQLCLAWLLAQGSDIFPIPGTTKIARVEENLCAIDVSLSDAEEKEIRKLVGGLVTSRFQESTGFAFADTPPL